MNSRDPVELPPDLARQLEAIERNANQLDTLGLVRSVYGEPAKRRPRARVTPARHAADAELRRADRESRRVRTLTLLAMSLGIAIAVGAYVAMRLDYALLGLAGLGIAGSLVGFGGVAAYFAHRRVAEAAAALARLDRP